MALLHSLALANAPNKLVFAALIGGDLGPRLLPIGSLAGLLWTHQLRQKGVIVPLGTVVRVGAIVTVPRCSPLWSRYGWRADGSLVQGGCRGTACR